MFAFEAGDPLEPPVVQRWSTFHPRCGTSFLMTVMLISIAVYALVPIRTFWAGFGMRLLLLPLIAGVSYEIIRFAAKHALVAVRHHDAPRPLVAAHHHPPA